MDKFENIIKEKYGLDTCVIEWGSCHDDNGGLEQKVFVTPYVDATTLCLIEEDLDEMYENYCGDKTIAFFLAYNH